MYSIALYLPLSLMEDGPVFKGWSLNAVILSALGSAGGLLVAFTMKYTDAVLKTFATSGAIIVCAVAGNLLLNSPLDIPIGIGSACTVLSLLNYSDNGGDGEQPAKAKAGTLPKAEAGRRSAAAGGGEQDDETAQPLLRSPPRQKEEV